MGRLKEAQPRWCAQGASGHWRVTPSLSFIHFFIRESCKSPPVTQNTRSPLTTHSAYIGTFTFTTSWLAPKSRLSLANPASPAELSSELTPATLRQLQLALTKLPPPQALLPHKSY